MLLPHEQGRAQELPIFYYWVASNVCIVHYYGLGS